MKGFRKLAAKAGTTNGNGTPNGNTNGNGHAGVILEITPVEPQETYAVVEAAAGESEAEESSSAMKKFITTLMAELRSRDEKVVELTELFHHERAEKEAALEWRLAREEEDRQRAIEEQTHGVGSRVGVDVSSILFAAEAAAETLRAASQAEADELLGSTKALAETTLTDANMWSEEILSRASSDAAEIRAQAEAEAAAFHEKMQKVVGEVRQAYASLGELATSLAHIEGPQPAAEQPAAEEPVEISI